MSHLARTLLAEIRQATGRQYPALEPLLDGMTEAQLRDFLRLVRDVREDENRRCRGQASRMGLPGLIR